MSDTKWRNLVFFWASLRASSSPFHLPLPWASLISLRLSLTLRIRTAAAMPGPINVLDQWRNESIYAVQATLDAIGSYGQDLRVQRSMAKIFGIANDKRRHEIRTKPDAIDEIEGTC